MTWETIKKILKKNHGTCIIVEDGQPVFVITEFDEYQKDLEEEPADKLSQSRLKESAGETELIEKINQEIVDWKAKQVESSPEMPLVDVRDSDEVRVENLPLV